MCSLLIAALAVTFQSGVTYTCPATPIGNVFKDLSQLSGKKISANEDTQQEVLYLSVQDMPLDRLLAKIAYVTSGEWEVSGDAYTLKAANGIRHKEEQDELDARAKGISASIRKRLKEIQSEASKQAAQTKAATTDGEGEFPTAPWGEGEELCLRFADSIDSSALAEISGPRRLVWATNNATNSQALLPDGSASMVTDWIANHNKNVGDNPETTAVPDTGTDLGDPKLNAQIQEMVRHQLAQTQPIKEPVVKALFVAKRGILGRGLNFEVKAYNRKGEVVLSTQATLGDEPDPKGEPSTANSSQLPEFKYSEDSKQVMTLLDAGPMGMLSQGKLPPALYQKLARLDQTEPLSLMPSDLMSYYAKVKQTQVVADVPDEMFTGGEGFLAMKSQPIKTGAEALAAVEKSKALRIEKDQDLVTVRSATPAESRLNHLSRKAFSQLIASVMDKGYLSLDDISGFALNNRRIDENPVAMTYAILYCPSFLQTAMLGMSSWNAYRFYGSLTPDQRSQVRRGAQESFQTLNSDQLQILSEYLFSSEAHFGGAEASKLDSSSPFGSMMDLGVMMGDGFDATKEPTELLPNGLVKGFVTQTSSTEPIIGFAPGSGMFSAMNLGASEYGMMKAAFSSGLTQGMNFTLPSQGRVGQRETIELVFHISPQVGAHCRLQDTFFDKSATYSALDKLPPEFTSKMDAATEMMKKIADQVGKGNGKSATP